MNEKRIPKLTQLAAQIKSHKKQVIIAAVIAIAIILLIILLLVVFSSKSKMQTEEPSTQEEISSVTEFASSSLQTKTEEVSDTDVTESQSSETVQAESTVKSPENSTVNSSVHVQSGSVQKTGYAPLDTLMSKILSGIISEGMTSNAKLNAIYNYVKRNMTYDMFSDSEKGLYDKLLSLGYADYDSRQMTMAYDAATSYRGVCDNYAALTMILARSAGIPLYQSGGLSYNGSSHAWNILFVNGDKYLVDTNYGIFMQRFSESGFTEQMDGSRYFNNFNTYVPSVEEKKISWMFNAGFGNQRFMGNDRGEITQNATIDRPLYSQGVLYPNPITPMVQVEGDNNSFSATVSSNGSVIETLQAQSGANQMYYFSWYPPNPGYYTIEITVKSDGIFTGHFFIYANITS